MQRCYGCCGSGCLGGGHQIKWAGWTAEGNPPHQGFASWQASSKKKGCRDSKFGSCRGLGAGFRPFWGPNSCPPQDVVVTSAPSPSGPQDVVELQQSNSTRVNDCQESFLTWEFEWLGAPRHERQVEQVTRTHALGAVLPTENAQNVTPPSVARAAALHPGEPYDSCLWVGRGITLCICGG